MFFFDFFWFFGPGRVPGGSGGAFGFIWTKFQPEWSHFGPVGAHFRFPIFWKPIRGPNSSQESLGSGPIWGPGPMEAEGRHYGGRRPTFWRGVGGRSPPTATQGVWGGGSPPTEKGPLELFAIAKSETLLKSASFSVVESSLSSMLSGLTSLGIIRRSKRRLHKG